MVVSKSSVLCSMLQAMLLLQMLSIATQADRASTPAQHMSKLEHNCSAELADKK